MLHLIGLGLHDVKDITVKGLERAQSCDAVYAEFYTAILAGSSQDELDALIGQPVKLLDREGVELGAKDLVEQAKTQEVALLTAGDPLTATTHTDLMVRCRAEGVPYRIVHAPSIYAAAPGLLGLQHYRFGRTTTLVRPEGDWDPPSPFQAIVANHEADLHTLVLLDIKADEPWFMTANDGIARLEALAAKVGADWFGDDTPIGVVARAGADEPTVVTGTVATLRDRDFGAPLHTLVVPASLHAVEQEAWDALAN